jgi:hypothetical protein
VFNDIYQYVGTELQILRTKLEKIAASLLHTTKEDSPYLTIPVVDLKGIDLCI